MAINIYHHKISVCSEKVRILLHEKSYHDWISHELNPRISQQLSPEYLKINPKGVVPTLVDENGTLTKSTLICEYLDDILPNTPLKPTNPFDVAQMRLYPKACDEGIHQAIAFISFSAVFMDRIKEKFKDDVEARLNRITDLERRARQMAVYKEGISSAYAYRAVAEFENLFTKIDRDLADGREWLARDIFSLAEINIAPYIARLDHLGIIDVWLDDKPNVMRWFERIQKRDSFIQQVTNCTDEIEMADFKTGGAKIRQAIIQHRQRYLEEDNRLKYT